MEKARVLVVDDEVVLCDMLAQVLKDEGYVADVAHDGSKALELMEQGNYHVAIVDDKMPVMDGIELLKQIAQKHPSTAVIIIAGYSNIDHAVEAIKLGALDYIAKPFEPKHFLLAVHRAAESKTEVQEGKCPKCHQNMQTEWRYCPYDGTSLA